MGVHGEAAAEETAEIEAGDATPGPDRTSWNSRTAPQFPISRKKKNKSTLNDFEEKNKCDSVQNQSRGGDRSRIRALFSGVTDAVAISENLWELSGTQRVVIQAR